MSTHLEDRLVTQMVIPVSKDTFFNTKWHSNREQLCAYDMLYHPPNYNPKAARSDRQEPKIIRRNIWDQEFHKGIPSTTHFQLGRPKWKPYDLPTKEFVRVHGKIKYVITYNSERVVIEVLLYVTPVPVCFQLKTKIPICVSIACWNGPLYEGILNKGKTKLLQAVPT